MVKDWSKPLRTIRGKNPVRFHGMLKGQPAYPALCTVEIDGVEQAIRTTIEGRYTHDSRHRLDLENAPEVRAETKGWVNCYQIDADREFICVHRTRAAADRGALRSREACLEITIPAYEVGQGLNK